RGAGNAVQQEERRSLTLSQVRDVTGECPDFSLGPSEWCGIDELGGQRRRYCRHWGALERRWRGVEARRRLGRGDRRERNTNRDGWRHARCGGGRRRLNRAALQDDIGGAGARNQLVLLVENLRVGHSE